MRIRKGILELPVSGGETLTGQISGYAGEVLDDVDIVQQYGFASVPAGYDADIDRGLECVLVNTDTNIPLVVAAEDPRYRPRTISDGEVVIYTSNDDPLEVHDNATQRIALTGDMRIVLRMGQSTIMMEYNKVSIISDTIETTGLWVHNGDIIVDGDVTATGISLVNHTHGGVQAGASNTSPPS